jgi:hypothetical protein
VAGVADAERLAVDLHRLARRVVFGLVQGRKMADSLESRGLNRGMPMLAKRGSLAGSYSCKLTQLTHSDPLVVRFVKL